MAHAHAMCIDSSTNKAAQATVRLLSFSAFVFSSISAELTPHATAQASC